MVRNREIELLASAARTATNTGAAVVIPTIAYPDGTYEGAARGAAYLDITAASGTSPTLDVKIEDSLDGVTYYTAGTFAQKTGTGKDRLNLPGPLTKFARAVSTIAGTTPSFTYSVKLLVADA